MWDDTPYIYDQFEDSELSTDPMRVWRHDLTSGETVITDGVAMSYRSYQGRQSE